MAEIAFVFPRDGKIVLRWEFLIPNLSSGSKLQGRIKTSFSPPSSSPSINRAPTLKNTLNVMWEMESICQWMNHKNTCRLRFIFELNFIAIADYSMKIELLLASSISCLENIHHQAEQPLTGRHRCCANNPLRSPTSLEKNGSMVIHCKGLHSTRTP